MGNSINMLVFQKKNRNEEDSRGFQEKLNKEENIKEKNNKKTSENNWKSSIFTNWSKIGNSFLGVKDKHKNNEVINTKKVKENTTLEAVTEFDANKTKEMENIKNIEKIKKENFYLFDESLNSNEVKHPCHAQWFLFWVFASYLNEQFSEVEKNQVHSFYSNFPDQCIEGKAKECYTQFISIYPVKANNREELMMWLQMCENFCRQKAGLPVKVFNYKKLLNRWRYDDGYV